MVILDVILGLLLLYGLFKGLKNGLLIELASLIALIAGLYGAIHFSYIAGEYLSKNMDWSESAINTIAFILTFIIIIILASRGRRGGGGGHWSSGRGWIGPLGGMGSSGSWGSGGGFGGGGSFGGGGGFGGGGSSGSW